MKIHIISHENNKKHENLKKSIRESWKSRKSYNSIWELLNHENPRIAHEKHENHKNPRIPMKHYENH